MSGRLGLRSVSVCRVGECVIMWFCADDGNSEGCSGALCGRHGWVISRTPG